MDVIDNMNMNINNKLSRNNKTGYMRAKPRSCDRSRDLRLDRDRKARYLAYFSASFLVFSTC